MDKDFSIDESALADALDVQLSTGEFTKYNITEPSFLDCHQRLWKRKWGMCPVSNGDSDE